MKLNCLAAIITSLALSACVSGQYGSFVKSPAVESTVIVDVSNKLKEEFPAANTVFVMAHSTKSDFDIKLDEALRQKGFATTATPGEKATSLDYVLDQVYADIYRVTVYVDSVPYSRAYQKDKHKVVPVGNWTKGK